jgi:hypothetical protein
MLEQLGELRRRRERREHLIHRVAEGEGVLYRSEARFAVAFRSSSWTGGDNPSRGSGEVITAWSKSDSLSQGIRPVRHS